MQSFSAICFSKDETLTYELTAKAAGECSFELKLSQISLEFIPPFEPTTLATIEIDVTVIKN